MFGVVEGKPAVNPSTGGQSCPKGFYSKQVLGTYGVDWPLFYCYK